MRQTLNAFWTEETATGIVEYSLLLALLALTGALVLGGLRHQNFNIWQAISSQFTSTAG